MTTPIDALCSGFPDAFGVYLNYCRALGFREAPDYTFRHQFFGDLCICEGYAYDHVFI